MAKANKPLKIWSYRAVCYVCTLSPCHPERMHKIGSTKAKFEGSLPLAATTILEGEFLCFNNSPNNYIVSCSFVAKILRNVSLVHPLKSHLLRMTHRECEHRYPTPRQITIYTLLLYDLNSSVVHALRQTIYGLPFSSKRIGNQT